MSSRTVVPEPTSADSETLLRNRHAQLFLRPEVMEETKALFAQHALQQGLQLNRKACDNFIVSFLPIYGPVLWRNAKASRQHLLNRGAAAPQYRAYRLRDPEVTAFALYRQRSATYPNDARAMLGHVDGESLAERYWQQLPNAGKAFWEEQAREHNKALESMYLQDKRAAALRSRLGELVAEYYTVLVGCKQSGVVAGTQEELLVVILGCTGPEDELRAALSETAFLRWWRCPRGQMPKRSGPGLHKRRAVWEGYRLLLLWKSF